MARNKSSYHASHHQNRTATKPAVDRLADVERLVTQWLTVPEIAELQNVSISQVRKQIQDRELVAVRRGERNVISVPAVFVTENGPRPELRGTVTVLADGGMSDEELLIWLFTPDETLPVPGTPMNALLSGAKTEVRRRAMEAAF